ncbi:MAG: hypothetical protein M3O74_13815 [Pseudomonadota bacterium]|nr:hypothetical protein [Pseudomonadota bacterium]
MEWIITKDLIAEPGEKTRVGYGALMRATVATLPPKGTAERNDAKKAYIATLPFEFRLYDDDNVLYYEGRCADITKVCADEAFAPQDWAMNEAGCTSTKYRKVGDVRWEDL